MKNTLEPFDLDNATRKKPGGGYVCGFGGGGGSSSSSNATTTTNTDKRLVADGGSVGISADNATINMLDQGAIKLAAGIADSAINSSTTNFGTLLETAQVLAKGSLDALSSNVKLAQSLSSSTQSAYKDSASQAQGNKNLVYAGMAVVGLAAVSYFTKKA